MTFFSVRETIAYYFRMVGIICGRGGRVKPENFMAIAKLENLNANFAKGAKILFAKFAPFVNFALSLSLNF
jgi:hypothetical protein